MPPPRPGESRSTIIQRSLLDKNNILRMVALGAGALFYGLSTTGDNKRPELATLLKTVQSFERYLTAGTIPKTTKENDDQPDTGSASTEES